MAHSQYCIREKEENEGLGKLTFSSPGALGLGYLWITAWIRSDVILFTIQRKKGVVVILTLIILTYKVEIEEGKIESTIFTKVNPE